jgi:hypothetical protein
MQARKLELHVCDHSSIWDNFQTTTDALHDCNLLERHHVETTCEDTCGRVCLTIVPLSLLKEN